jgi:acyl-CoA synthetase (AMP-forming)/AMP-acid ligase II
MLADCGAKRFFLDRSVAKALEGISLTMPLTALDGSDAGGSYEAWLAPAGSKPSPVTVTPAMPFNIIYSSGTTGTPKGIVQSHEMRWSHTGRGGGLGYGPGSVTLLSTPLYSNTTLVSFFPTMGMGGAAVLMDKFDALGFLKLSHQHRVTHAMLVPVQYRRILEQPTFGDYDLSSFQMKFCTSAPFGAALKADILKRWPGGLIEYYGMTEGGGSCGLIAHEHPDKLHTVGQPLPGHDVRLIDEEGRELPAGDRASLQAIAFGTIRSLLRLQPAIASLANRDWSKTAAPVRALLLTGVFELEDAATPPHAVVTSTVEAVRVLGQPKAAGYVNALLRRWQRERASALFAADRSPAGQSAHPHSGGRAARTRPCWRRRLGGVAARF